MYLCTSMFFDLLYLELTNYVCDPRPEKPNELKPILFGLYAKLLFSVVIESPITVAPNIAAGLILFTQQFTLYD